MRNELEIGLWSVLVRERQGFFAKNMVFTRLTSYVLRPTSSNFVVGMDLAGKVVPVRNGIGL